MMRRLGCIVIKTNLANKLMEKEIKKIKQVVNMPKIKEELREKLADIEHQRWADWQRYVFSHEKAIEYRIEMVLCKVKSGMVDVYGNPKVSLGTQDDIDRLLDEIERIMRFYFLDNNL